MIRGIDSALVGPPFYIVQRLFSDLAFSMVGLRRLLADRYSEGYGRRSISALYCQSKDIKGLSKQTISHGTLVPSPDNGNGTLEKGARYDIDRSR